MQRYLILILPIFVSLLSIILSPMVVISSEIIVRPEYYIQSEYRKDSIDYSEIERTFYREKFKVVFSNDSSLRFAYVHIDKYNDNKYTYSLALGDISPYASFIIGNYYVNFGYGLMVGRKRIYDPDVFSPRMNIASRDVFKPCGSGNPIFAFNGLSASLKEEISEIKLSLNIFYSIKERFIDENSYNVGKTTGSMDAIDYKLTKEYNHNEPIDMHTHGAMLSLSAMDLFFFQVYYLSADLQSVSGGEILWDFDETGDQSYGISSLLGCGFVSEYRDDFISIFFEGSVANREMKNEISEIQENVSDNIYGYGYLHGIIFTPPFLVISIIGKDVGPEYYSPYSSSVGEDYPEKGWFFDAELRPFRNLKIGTSISSQKKSSVTSSRYDELPNTQRERIYLHYSYGFFKDLNIILRRIEKKSDDSEKKFQLRESTRLEISKLLKLRLYNTYQSGNNVNSSKLFGVGFEVFLHSYLKTDIHYFKGYISEGNAIYSVVSPIQHSNIRGFFLREDSDLILLKSSLKYKGFFLSSRWFYQFVCKRSIHKRFEFVGSGFF
ncbi:MAG: hypothetical protein SVZ03_03210 [Spirochaetota bacterium]|nr:hypothetical protein [Spirochaetota bacterium]